MGIYSYAVAMLVIWALAAAQIEGRENFVPNNIREGEETPTLSEERVVFQIAQGDIEFAFFPEVAPVTTAHIFELVSLGMYTGNHFFRVDKGFVAQTAEVMGGRSQPMNEQQTAVGTKNVPLEVRKGVKHHEGIVSMARGTPEDSGGSSFFIMLGSAPHLDMQYGIFGRVTKGLDVLHMLEALPTKRDGIFVMPLDRITITNSYWYRAHGPLHLRVEGAGGGTCEEELEELTARFESQAEDLQAMRKKCLPGS